MKNGGQIPWNVLPICETCKISRLMGRPQVKDGSENNLKVRSFRLVHSLVEYFNISAKKLVKNPSVWKESLTWIVPWIRSVRARNLEG